VPSGDPAAGERGAHRQGQHEREHAERLHQGEGAEGERRDVQRAAGRVQADREPPPSPPQQRQDGNAHSVGGQSLLHHCPRRVRRC
jgi:hypothetical protein